MSRALAGWILSGVALVTGVATSALSSQNRARGDDLDELERWCEAQGRRNELGRAEIERQELLLLHGHGAEPRVRERAGKEPAP